MYLGMLIQNTLSDTFDERQDSVSQVCKVMTLKQFYNK